MAVLDALVIGGGPAGLSAALHLARYDRTVTVLDAAAGRSRFRQVNRNYLGFPDGIAITELIQRGEAQLAHYSHAEVARKRVEELRSTDGLFHAVAPDGSWTARSLVLATGVRDDYPRFAGWEACVGVSVFWCITCDGWESRGKRIVVVGSSDTAGVEALQLHRLTGSVVVLTNSDTDDITPEVRDRLHAQEISVVHDRIDSAEHDDGRLRRLRTKGGAELELDVMFSLQGMHPESGLARQLGVRCDDDGYVTVDLEQRTSVPGVVAAGDVTCIHSHAVTAAVHEGAQAAAAAHAGLYPMELRAP